MRTKIAQILWDLAVSVKNLSQKICDHKKSKSAQYEDYKTTFCWTCGK